MFIRFNVLKIFHDPYKSFLQNMLETVTKRFLPRHIKEEYSKSREFNCDFCGCVFTKGNRIKLPMVQIHSNGEYKCILCSIKFKNVHELFTHKRIHIGNPNTNVQNAVPSLLQTFFSNDTIKKFIENQNGKMTLKLINFL